ncbi:MAG: TfoX/Sxy family protein [Proteobacteria bacterium]|nr:TfoX/Sxy family protein [Pseudomonadota bacterium]
MATDSDFIGYIHEQAGLEERLTHKRMFGEYGIYLDGKVVAFACDNSLFLKPTDAARVLLPTVTPGKPYPEAKDYFVLDEYLDDSDLLRRLLQATADAVPMPKPKPKASRRAVQRGAAKAPRKRTDKPAR